MKSKSFECFEVGEESKTCNMKSASHYLSRFKYTYLYACHEENEASLQAIEQYIQNPKYIYIYIKTPIYLLFSIALNPLGHAIPRVWSAVAPLKLKPHL